MHQVPDMEVALGQKANRSHTIFQRRKNKGSLMTKTWICDCRFVLATALLSEQTVVIPKKVKIVTRQVIMIIWMDLSFTRGTDLISMLAPLCSSPDETNMFWVDS